MLYGKINGLDKDISRIVLGCAGLRSDRLELSMCHKLFDTAYENGINTYDTAVIYGDSEIVLGKWIEEKMKSDSGFREKITVISKGAHYSGLRMRTTEYDILTDIHDSLAKLRQDYIDIYLLHRDDENYPVAPIVDVLNRLKDEGKIKIFGVSNWSPERIDQANEYAHKHQLEKINVSSPNFTLGRLNKKFCAPDDANVSCNDPAFEWYKKTNMPVLSWSSLACGFFAGVINSKDRADAKNILKERLYEVMANDYNFEVLSKLEEQAKKENKTVMQVTFENLISQPFPVYPIFSTSKIEHILEAANSL